VLRTEDPIDLAAGPWPPVSSRAGSYRGLRYRTAAPFSRGRAMRFILHREGRATHGGNHRDVLISRACDRGRGLLAPFASRRPRRRARHRVAGPDHSRPVPDSACPAINRRPRYPYWATLQDPPSEPDSVYDGGYDGSRNAMSWCPQPWTLPRAGPATIYCTRDRPCVDGW